MLMSTSKSLLNSEKAFYKLMINNKKIRNSLIQSMQKAPRLSIQTLSIVRVCIAAGQIILKWENL